MVKNINLVMVFLSLYITVSLFAKDNFNIYWFEGHSKNGHDFRFSNWPPYSPEFNISTERLDNPNTYNRIKMLLEDSVATGIIQYNDLPGEVKEEFYYEIASLPTTFFFQAYNIIDKKSYPYERFPTFLTPFVDTKNVNYYVVDDFHEDIWLAEEASDFSHLLRQSNKDKLLLACPGIQSIINKQNLDLDNYDLVAFQNYPLIKRFNEYENIENKIPLYNNFRYFHKDLKTCESIMKEYKQTNLNKISYGFALQAFHDNRRIDKGSSATAYRFPTYEEFRFMFYDAIICGAEFLCIYNSFQISKDCYEDVKNIIHEFRDFDFDEAIANGNLQANFYVKETEMEIASITFLYEDIYYSILANISEKHRTVRLEINKRKSLKILDISNNELKLSYNNLNLVLNPYDIILVKLK